MRLIFIITALISVTLMPFAKMLCVRDMMLHAQFSSIGEHVHHDDIDDGIDSGLDHHHKHRHAPGEPEHEHSHSHLAPNLMDQTVYFKSPIMPNYQLGDQPNAFVHPKDPKFLVVVSEIFRPPIS